MRLVDACLRFGGAGFGATAQPFNLGAHTIFERLLPALLRFKESFLVLKKAAVIATCAQDAIRVDRIDFGDFERYGFEEVTVVADGHGGEGCAVQHPFQPLDALQVKMVRRLVQQEHIGRRCERLRDGETFAPATGEREGGGGEVGEAGAAKRFANLAIPVCGRQPRLADRILHRRPDGVAGGEAGDLRHVADASTFADGQITRVGLDLSSENLQQRGFTCAVWADQADAHARIHGEGKVAEERACAEGFRDALRVEERWHRSGDNGRQRWTAQTSGADAQKIAAVLASVRSCLWRGSSEQRSRPAFSFRSFQDTNFCPNHNPSRELHQLVPQVVLIFRGAGRGYQFRGI